MRLKGCSIAIIWLLALSSLHAQYTLSGNVIDASTNSPITNAEVFDQSTNQLATTNARGEFTLSKLPAGEHKIIIVSLQYQTQEQVIDLQSDQEITLRMKEFEQELSEVVISQKREEIFALKRLKPVEGTAIYAGKKTEVVIMDQMVGNMATNNARQIYSQVVGLNIYESVNAGLQLNVGGRGLDPNRSANFNTRQNGYDISADVLGYPESYYAPPAEALGEIQVIRGAASLQYGTQFGGLINFKMKKPSVRPIEFISRQSIGSFNLINSFNSLSGTKGKFSYFTYYQYKAGDGFRDNSEFSSHNFFGSFSYQFTEKTSVTLEATYLHYLAEQAGGLTDTQFKLDPDFSNRTRNWFEIDWRLLALKLEHKFSSKSDLSLTVFGLDAERNALGFRGALNNPNINPITQEDEQESDGSFIYPRDLIKGNFNNWGAELRFLSRYKLGGKDAVFLIGSKFYHANNTSVQGPGSNNTNADFTFRNQEYSGYPSQSNFIFPNRNLALFGEHIFFINDRLSITPGVRYEYIKTESTGTYRQVNYDNAGNPISNKELTDNRMLDRSFALFGVGVSYEPNENLEVYINLSQNYRSVTFSDIRVVNPTFIIDPNISDERGYTFDIGMRGKWKNHVSYDLGVFGLLYDGRIGTVLDDRANRIRGNVGEAIVYGVEAFADWNLVDVFSLEPSRYKLNLFVNGALTGSEYIQSELNNVIGKKVEFIPAVNLKTGINFGYRNFLGSLQLTHLTEQFTDVENSPIPSEGDSRNGLIGEIPPYTVMDISLSYGYKKWKLETGINNFLNEKYFTRRATGYPGPGIIPSDPRIFYLSLQVKL
jgi:Fe(3+) dicitrate transport protein